MVLREWEDVCSYLSVASRQQCRTSSACQLTSQIRHPGRGWAAGVSYWVPHVWQISRSGDPGAILARILRLPRLVECYGCPDSNVVEREHIDSASSKSIMGTATS